MAKQEDYVRYTIRVPKELYAAIERSAAEANRSINAEVIENLTFAQYDDIGDRAELLLRIRDKEIELKTQVRDLSEMEKDMKFLVDVISDKDGIIREYRDVIAMHRTGILQFGMMYKTLAAALTVRAGEIPQDLLDFAKTMADDAEEIAKRFSTPLSKPENDPENAALEG